ncbi:unnamed protein product, partial [Ranitomeya imitator]
MEQRGTSPRCSPCLRGRKGLKAPRRSTPSLLSRESKEMMGKAEELFQLCDKEEKGLITKRDLQFRYQNSTNAELRLQNELPLTPDQLEAVFDSLDQSNNGYLTPVEFSMGLGKLLGVNIANGEEDGERQIMEETFESGWSDEDDDTEEMLFCATMEQLGATRIVEEHRQSRYLWNRLRKECPDLLTNFEDLLFGFSSDIRDVHREKETLEQALKRKEIDHGREVRSLYDEMEQQIKLEKERHLRKKTHRLCIENCIKKRIKTRIKKAPKKHQKKDLRFLQRAAVSVLKKKGGKSGTCEHTLKPDRGNVALNLQHFTFCMKNNCSRWIKYLQISSTLLPTYSVADLPCGNPVRKSVRILIHVNTTLKGMFTRCGFCCRSAAVSHAFTVQCKPMGNAIRIAHAAEKKNAWKHSGLHSAACQFFVRIPQRFYTCFIIENRSGIRTKTTINPQEIRSGPFLRVHIA